MLKLTKDKWPALFAALAGEGELYVPAEKNGKVDFTKYKEGVQVDLEATQTAKSLKDIFFPQVEDLMEFTTGGKRLNLKAAPLPNQKTIALGVRACDARSFQLLDMVFLKEPVDTFYKARRENCLLIGLGCSAPEETCFCGSFGIDATRPATDVQTWLVQDQLYWEPVTQAGKDLTAKLEALFTTTEPKPVEEQAAATKAIMAKLPLANFKVAAKITKDELTTFNSSVWAQASVACLSCCSCTYVCPTCHCYDVRDYTGVEGRVERFRCWDSCMASDFTKMAHGNPRKTKLERFRQRYMHKLVYFPENNDGTYACVGCGRCLQKCPVNLNIVKVAKALEVAQDV